MTPFILLILGLLFIFIEFYIPGAIMGIAGGVLIATSVFLFAAQIDTAWAVILYVIAIVIALSYLVKFALWRIRTAKPGMSIYSDDDQQGYVASCFDHSAVGKKGVVLSDLKPGGYILIDGVQHQALSESGYITKGSPVIVVAGQEESLIVKLIHTEGPTQ